MENIVNPILEGNFFASSKKNSFYKVKLDERYLGIVKSNGTSIKTRIISLKDVLGCKCTRRRKRIGEKCDCHPNNQNVFSFLENEPDETDISAYLHVYSYTLNASGQKRERFKITLRFRTFSRYEDNLKEAIKWKTTVKQLVTQSHWHAVMLKNVQKSGDTNLHGNEMLIVLNPKSGPGKARDIFQDKVLPLLTEADLNYDLHITRGRNDARNLMKNSNVLKWRKGIISIGGDGILFEIINGVMERPDWKHIINTIPFGIIPGGSGNGLAKSLSTCTKEPYNANPILIATLSVIKGYPIPVDVVRVETISEVVFSFLSFGWGLIADIDIESERIRIIGSPRFHIWSIAKLIGLRSYTGRLSFLRVPTEKIKEAAANDQYVDIEFQDSGNYDEDNDQKSTMNTDRNSNCSFGMESISLDTGCNQCDADKVIRSESFHSLKSHASVYHSEKASIYLSLPEITKNNKKTIYGPSSRLPSIHKPVPKSWEVYQGEFVLVHASSQSHLAEDVYFAPNCKPNDGIIWLLVVKAGISRINLLQFLLGMSTGNHLKYPFVEMIPVLAFRLEPMCKGSHLVVDGEVIEKSPVVQAEMFPGLISLLSR